MKKNFLITLLAVLLQQTIQAQTTGTFTDSRDGKTYKTVKIGGKTWMAENLAYKMSENCWAYDSREFNVKKYGYYYTYDAAMKSCPTGWHLPTDLEWDEMQFS